MVIECIDLMTLVAFVIQQDKQLSKPLQSTCNEITVQFDTELSADNRISHPKGFQGESRDVS